MDDESHDWMSGRRATAIKEVEKNVKEFAEIERLTPLALSRYHKHHYNLGWKVSVNFSDGIRRDLHILAKDNFPYVPPRIALAKPPAVLAWPHLESEGHLCILSSEAAVSNENPAAVVEHLLGRACVLVEDSVHERNANDFRQEFLSYWDLSVDSNSQKCISLLEPTGPSRSVSIWRGQTVRIIGENPKILEQWLTRWGAEKGKSGNYSFAKGLFVPLDTPLVPMEYPRYAPNVQALIQKYSPKSIGMIEELVTSEENEIDVVLGAQTQNGFCLAAITISPPRSSKGSPKHRVNVTAKGFRPGRIPKKLLVDLYFSEASKVVKRNVERADHLWIHGRDRDPQQECLRNTRVAILGCGSVGSSLARLLAKSGVGNLLLVDHEDVDWPNISRHALGANSVNRNKAKELAHNIEKAYPHLCEVLFHEKRVAPTEQELMGELACCNLVISTMGNWAAESFLNEAQKNSDKFPPILYGWVEPSASAAHVLLIRGDNSCLRCGTDDKGHPLLTVTDWPNGGDHLQEPACGATFTPYGAVELCWAHALLAEATLDVLTDPTSTEFHRIWVGTYNRIKSVGGSWSSSWIEEIGDPGDGGVKVQRQWLPSASCPVCKYRRDAA